ncbi:uncharacterized protein LOC143072186 [Mytilus galloprovincialis]|uniref:uncharacterized protein LOC143072186 n=1 Tax=Mytilus galloprovincialis TaxID=29158 RepID=UPI003F7C9466
MYICQELFIVIMWTASVICIPSDRPICKVKVLKTGDYATDKFTCTAIHTNCSNRTITKYLEFLPDNLNPPQVSYVKIMNHSITSRTVNISVSWQYLKPVEKNIRLKGFLLKIETWEPLISRYVVVKNKGKRRKLNYQLTNINLPEATNASFVEVSVWSLVRYKNRNYRRREKLSNVDKCRWYSEKYEKYGKTAEFERSKRTIQRTITTPRGPTDSCKCLKNDLSVNLTSTSIVVRSSNICPIDTSIRIDSIFLLEMPKNSTKQYDKDNCYFNFTRIPAGIYTLKILFHCPEYSDEPPTCVKSKHINKTNRLSPQALSFHQKITIDDRIRWLQYTIGIITAAFVIFVLVVVYILWHRKKKKSHNRHHDDTENAQHEPLINNQVLLISFAKSSGVATTVSRFEEMINITFGIKTTNTTNLFNQLLYEESLSKTPETIESNLIELIGNFNHVIFVATKDLCETYHVKANLCDTQNSISRNNEELLHFKLAKIIKDLQAKPHPSIWCHFVAFDKTQNSYCENIFSYMSPPEGHGRKYRLVRSDHVKDLRNLIKNLPSSKSNKELLIEITQFSRKILVETLQPRNNAIAIPNIPPMPGPSSQFHPDRDVSDPSLTEPKSGTAHSTDVKESQGATCGEVETPATYPRSMEQTDVKIVDEVDSSTKTKTVESKKHDTVVKTLVETDTYVKSVVIENDQYPDTILKTPQGTSTTTTTVNGETNQKTIASTVSSNQCSNCTYPNVHLEHAVQLPVQSNQAVEIPTCSYNEDNDQDTSQELQGLSYIKTSSDIEDN